MHAPVEMNEMCAVYMQMRQVVSLTEQDNRLAHYFALFGGFGGYVWAI